jgi:hypothetical protein
VPDIALYATIKAFQRPSFLEGFDELYDVRLGDDGGFEIAAWTV